MLPSSHRPPHSSQPEFYSEQQNWLRNKAAALRSDPSSSGRVGPGPAAPLCGAARGGGTQPREPPGPWQGQQCPPGGAGGQNFSEVFSPFNGQTLSRHRHRRTRLYHPLDPPPPPPQTASLDSSPLRLLISVPQVRSSGLLFGSPPRSPPLSSAGL